MGIEIWEIATTLHALRSVDTAAMVVKVQCVVDCFVLSTRQAIVQVNRTFERYTFILSVSATAEKLPSCFVSVSRQQEDTLSNIDQDLECVLF